APLVTEQQRLVGGVELGRLERVDVGAAGIHEPDGAVDLGSGLLIALVTGVRGEEAAVPIVDEAQVGEPALGEGADEVQRRGGYVVRLEQTLGVVSTGL